MTTVAACGLSHAVGGPFQLTAGLLVGGFLIDVDHYLDYVLIEGQRSINPKKFLRYYLEGKLNRAVLILHSYELFALLWLIADLTANQILVGYLLGATMHLALDIYFNGKSVLRQPFLFYSFFYRMSNRFLASRMIDIPSKDWTDGLNNAGIRIPESSIHKRLFTQKVMNTRQE